jgi:hypothetical protein
LFLIFVVSVEGFIHLRKVRCVRLAALGCSPCFLK